MQIFLWSLDDQGPVQRWHRSWLGFISDFSEVEELKQVRRKGNVGFSDFCKVYKHSYQMEAQRKELNGWVQSRRQDFRVCPHGVHKTLECFSVTYLINCVEISTKEYVISDSCDGFAPSCAAVLQMTPTIVAQNLRQFKYCQLNTTFMVSWIQALVSVCTFQPTWLFHTHTFVFFFVAVSKCWVNCWTYTAAWWKACLSFAR